MGKESFKLFVRNHPNLNGYVASGSMTWQKFYEMYDMYGENSIIWDPYQSPINSSTEGIRASQQESKTTSKKTESSWKDILQLVKGVDLATVQKGIDGVQKAIGLVQDLTGKTTPTPNTYEPRPMYKYFED